MPRPLGRDPVSASSWSPPSPSSQLPYIVETLASPSSAHAEWQESDSNCSENPNKAPTETDIVHFAAILGRKWACHFPGHEMCFVGESVHIRLSDEQIMAWVSAWCEGRATATRPPSEIFPNEDTSSASSAYSENELLTPSSQIQPNSSYLDLSDRSSSSFSSVLLLNPEQNDDQISEVSPSSSGFDINFSGRSQHRHSAITERSTWSPYSTIASSSPTLTSLSGSTRQGRQRTKAKWLKAAVLLNRGNGYLGRLKKWQKTRRNLGQTERTKALHIVGHAVEMSRQGYSARVHKASYEIARELQKWLQMFTENELQASQENMKLLLVVQASLVPILLRRVSEADPGAAQLASELVAALTRIPLPLQDSDMEPSSLFYSPVSSPLPSPSIITGATSSSRVVAVATSFNEEDAPTYSIISAVSSVVIHLVASELGAEEPTCKEQHPWLGVNLLRIVELTLKLREEEAIGLTSGELDAIWGIGIRREEEFKVTSQGNFDASPNSIRPHEVALLALCASASSAGSLSSFFTLSVLGKTGVPLLVSSLKALVETEAKVNWEDVALILRALAFLSEHGWVIRGLSNKRESSSSAAAAENERIMVKALLAVFRRPIPERWFSIRFWAMDTIRNMLSQQPGKDLVRILTDEDAVGAFESLFDARNPVIKRLRQSPFAIENKDAVQSSNQVRASPDDLANIRQRMKEQYQREAALRAEELVRYLRIWERVVDEDIELTGQAQLNVVSITGMEYGS